MEGEEGEFGNGVHEKKSLSYTMLILSVAVPNSSQSASSSSGSLTMVKAILRGWRRRNKGKTGDRKK